MEALVLPVGVYYAGHNSPNTHILRHPLGKEHQYIRIK